MEPPAKRIRLTKPPHYDPDDDYHDEDDDDTFDSSSERGSARDRSDGYEDGFDEDDDEGSQEAYNEPDDDDLLAQERAKLDNRFQQAMAGIFSKYGRDFEGIGDEVDLETGDVIVDNGHLKNMRYENDVGVDEDLEEGGVRLEDLEDDSDNEDEGMALTDIPDDWGQACSADGERVETDLEGAGEASLLQPVTSKNNPFMGFIARQPSPYTTAIFAPAEPALSDSETPGDKGKGSEAAESHSLASASKPKPAPPVGQQMNVFGSYDGQDSIWAPGPRFKDHWPSTTKSQATMKDHSRNADSGVLQDRSLNESQRRLPNFQEGKPKELMQANSRGADDDLSTYLVLGEPEGPADKSSVAPYSRNSAEKEQWRTKNPESKHSRQNHVQAEGPGGLENLDEEMSASVDESAASRRRSGRARKKVDFLGLTSWDEALQDDVSNQLALESRNENRSVDDINDDQGLPTPPESGHDTSDSEHPNAPKSSRNETLPDSQETSTSRRSSPPRHSMAGDKKVDYAFGNSTHDLSDDESPIVFTKIQSPTIKERGCPTRRNPEDTLTLSDESESTTVQYTLAASTLALSDDESPVILKNTKPNIRKKQQLPESIEKKTRATTEEPESPLAVASESVHEESGQISSEQPVTSVQRDQPKQGAPVHEENCIVQPSETADVPMTHADVAPLLLESKTEIHTESVAQPEHLESEDLQGVPEENESELWPPQNSAEPVPEQIPTEVPRKPPAIAGAVVTDEAPGSSKAIATEAVTQAAREARQDEHQEPTVPSEEAPSCNKSSQTIADSQEESTDGLQSSAEGPSSSSSNLPAPAHDSAQSPSATQSPKAKTSSQPKQPSRDPTPSTSLPEGEASPITSSLPSRPLRSPPRRSENQRETSKETSSPLKRPSARSTPSGTPFERRSSVQASSPLKKPSLNPTPSKPQTERQSSTKPSKSRRSILTLVQDDDDDELLGNEADAVTLPKLLGTPSKRSRVWKTSARTTEQFRTPTKKKDREVFSPGSVVKTPGGSKKVCGVDGFRCERDFCFSCLS